MQFSIRVYKQYFNFASAHFMIFENGTREPLHGHNYRVQVRGETPELSNDMVFDFLDIKPIVREICQRLDHKLLLPQAHPLLRFDTQNSNLILTTPDGNTFSFPEQDVLCLPIENTSSERIAIYLNQEIRNLLDKRYHFRFKVLEVEVEETPGQSAIYIHKEESL
jgi:6-pyruvoyl tetrahydropterin synthase/QueD family protein